MNEDLQNTGTVTNDTLTPPEGGLNSVATDPNDNAQYPGGATAPDTDNSFDGQVNLGPDVNSMPGDVSQTAPPGVGGEIQPDNTFPNIITESPGPGVGQENPASAEPPPWYNSSELQATPPEVIAQPNQAVPVDARPPVFDTTVQPAGIPSQNAQAAVAENQTQEVSAGDNSVTTENSVEEQGTATPPTETSSNETETPATETGAPAATATGSAQSTDNKDMERIKTLQDKMSGHTATAEELEELRNLEQNPSQRMEFLEQKVNTGTVTDLEAQELAGLYTKLAEKTNPQQEATNLQTDIKNLKEALITKLSNGELITPAELQRFRELWGEKVLIDQGLDPDVAEKTAQQAFGAEDEQPPQQTQPGE